MSPDESTASAASADGGAVATAELTYTPLIFQRTIPCAGEKALPMRYFSGHDRLKGLSSNLEEYAARFLYEPASCELILSDQAQKDFPRHPLVVFKNGEKTTEFIYGYLSNNAETFEKADIEEIRAQCAVLTENKALQYILMTLLTNQHYLMQAKFTEYLLGLHKFPTTFEPHDQDNCCDCKPSSSLFNFNKNEWRITVIEKVSESEITYRDIMVCYVSTLSKVVDIVHRDDKQQPTIIFDAVYTMKCKKITQKECVDVSVIDRTYLFPQQDPCAHYFVWLTQCAGYKSPFLGEKQLFTEETLPLEFLKPFMTYGGMKAFIAKFQEGSGVDDLDPSPLRKSDVLKNNRLISTPGCKRLAESEYQFLRAFIFYSALSPVFFNVQAEQGNTCYQAILDVVICWYREVKVKQTTLVKEFRASLDKAIEHACPIELLMRLHDYLSFETKARSSFWKQSLTDENIMLRQSLVARLMRQEQLHLLLFDIEDLASANISDVALLSVTNFQSAPQEVGVVLERMRVVICMVLSGVAKIHERCADVLALCYSQQEDRKDFRPAYKL